MATTYKSDYVTNGYPVPAPMNGCVMAIRASFTQTAAFVLNDVVQFFTMPNGYQIHDIILDTPQLDTNVSPTITLDLGDTTTAQAYIAADTGAQGASGAVLHAKVAGYSATTPYAIATSGGNAGTTTIQMKVHAAPATGTTNKTIYCQILYSQQPGVASASFS